MAIGSIADRPVRAAAVVCVLSTSLLHLYCTVFAPPRVWKQSALDVVLLANALIFLAAWVWRRSTLRASVSWPSASGLIWSVKVRQDSRNYPFQGSWALDIGYSYKIEGERYAGFAQWRFRKEADADAAAARLRDASVLVKYNPRDPQFSLLT